MKETDKVITTNECGSIPKISTSEIEDRMLLFDDHKIIDGKRIQVNLPSPLVSETSSLQNANMINDQIVQISQDQIIEEIDPETNSEAVSFVTLDIDWKTCSEVNDTGELIMYISIPPLTSQNNILQANPASKSADRNSECWLTYDTRGSLKYIEVRMQ